MYRPVAFQRRQSKTRRQQGKRFDGRFSPNVRAKIQTQGYGAGDEIHDGFFGLDGYGVQNGFRRDNQPENAVKTAGRARQKGRGSQKQHGQRQDGDVSFCGNEQSGGRDQPRQQR